MIDKDTAISRIKEIKTLCPDLILEDLEFLFLETNQIQPKKEIKIKNTKETQKPLKKEIKD
jgi:hypothetical protein